MSWLKYVKIEKKRSRWAVSFRFTDADEEFSGCRCSGDNVLEIFIGYTRTKREAQALAREWLTNQAREILTECAYNAL